MLSRSIVAPLVVYAILFDAFVLAHVAAKVYHRKNFQVVARIWYLGVLDLLIEAGVVTVVVLRECYELAGRSFSCPLMAFVSYTASVVYSTSFVLRGISFICTFDPRSRKRFMHLVRPKTLLAICCSLFVFPVLGAAVMGAVDVDKQLRVCQSKMCQRDSCLFQSQYYVTMPIEIAASILFVAVVERIGRMHMDDDSSHYRDLVKCSSSHWTFYMIYWLLIIFMDKGVIGGETWNLVLTALVLVDYLINFLFHHAIPAYRYGFSPFTRTNKVEPLTLPTKVVCHTANEAEDGVNVDDVLGMPVLREQFIEYCKTNHCEELMNFLTEVQRFKIEVMYPDSWVAMRRMRLIYEQYLKPDAKDEINISAKMKEAMLKEVAWFLVNGAGGPASRARALVMLDPVTDDVKRMLNSNVLFAFKKTEKYQVSVGYLMVGN